MKQRLLLLLAGILLTVNQINAQQEIINVLKGGQHDANLIAKEYLRPYGEMLGVNLNSGWYNSAKVHKIGGFDLTITGSYSSAPSNKESFDVSALPLQQLVADKATAPTMAGSKDQSISFADKTTGQDLVTLNGSDLNYFVSPMLQAAVGLPFHTEVMGRFMPRVNYGDYGQTYMWGLGVKHSLKDYIPFVKRVPFLQLSALAAYTHFQGSLGVNHDDFGSGKLETMANGYTGRLLIGANFPVVCFYSGIGYGNTKSNFDLVGDFNVGDEFDDPTKPIALDYATNNFDFNVGMRVRLALFSLHADYSVGDYSTITAGVGINFR